MSEAKATRRPSRRAQPRWGWSGAAEMTYPMGLEETLGEVLNLLPTTRSSRDDLTNELLSLAARYGRYWHQDENGPTRAEQIAALWALSGCLQTLRSCVNNVPDHLHRSMSKQLLMNDCEGVIGHQGVGKWDAYQSDSSAVALLALTAADLERILGSSATEGPRRR